MVEEDLVPNLPSHFAAIFNKKYVITVPEQLLQPELVAYSYFGDEENDVAGDEDYD